MSNNWTNRPTVQWHEPTKDHHHDVTQTPNPETGKPESGGWGHRLLMLACCVPMFLIVFALVASGTAGSGAILFAVLCTVMMGAMMFMMPGHRH